MSRPLAAAVLVLVAALPASPPAAQDALDAPRAALRDGRLEDARAGFERRLSEAPRDADALVGAGFTALRQDRLAAALALFERCVAVAPAYADAHFGLALAADRLGDRRAARVHLRDALRLDPRREEFREAEARLGAPAPPLPPLVRPAGLDLRFRVSRARGLEARTPEGFQPVFLKGVNLGAALPGRHPSEFPGPEIYAAWLEEIAEAGFNAIRVYTIHPPSFYEALRHHNARSSRPLYLVHGVWVEPPPREDFGDPAWRGAFESEMRRVVDLLHGRADLPDRPGHASGAYRADVSPWVAAYVIGREWEPDAVVAYDARHPGEADFGGRFVRLRRGTATELFLAKAMEHMLAYEHDTHRAQRPMAFTSWPTLDPLRHPTESTRAEEAALRVEPLEPGQVIKEYDNDAASLDMERFDGGPELEAGLFAAYHAYPYYPDFMNLDPGYAAGRDHLGSSRYAAYLADLVRHHRKHAVIVAEVGVPASRLVAHWQPDGLTHGGQDERAQGEQDARLLRNVHDAGCAGAILFAWVDEWFKKNWLVIELEEPRERKPLWYNPQDAEENYGLVGYRPGADGPRVLVDGRPDDWAPVPVHLAGQGLSVKLLADEGWLHAAVSWSPGAFDPATQTLLLGVDTHGLREGDHRLPFGLPLDSAAGLEHVVRFAPDGAAVLADEWYDLFTHRYRRPHRSRENRDGLFVMPRTESNRPRIGRDGTRFAAHRQEIGWLRRGTQDRTDPAFDSGAEWQLGPGFLEARIPWGLLQVSDPSSRRVVRDGPAQRAGPVGTAVTEGFRVLAVTFTNGDGTGRPAVGKVLPPARGGRVPAPPLFTWAPWEAPTFHRFRKLGFEIVQRALRELPDAPRPPP